MTRDSILTELRTEQKNRSRHRRDKSCEAVISKARAIISRLHGCGLVFSNAAGRERVLHSFAGGTDGAFPYAGLARDSAGNLYGTTSSGGTKGHAISGFGLLCPTQAP